ncbi:MAG: TrbI/VirB10 family protein [Acidobacteria bacterium]|nr:TrbI/VirB10 family protein [Acidobacteriota bacterium]MYG74184.1 TrbI/VirB10 family protein [Acidobacteriota bacterium]
MPDWKSIATRPAGALPANLTTKAAVVLLGVLVAALVLSTVLTRDDPEEGTPDVETDPAQQPVADAGMTRRLQTEIEQQQRRDASQRRASDREATRQRIRDAIRGPAADPDAPPPDPVIDPDTGEALSPAEAELRDTLRLEEIERRLRSLRAGPLAHTYREPLRGRTGERAPAPPAAGQGLPDPVLHPLAASAARSADALLDALSRPGAAGDGSGAVPTPGELDVPLPDSRQLPDYDDPPRFTLPPNPPGWERIHEGSLVEAVLVNQLSGDFPSPVLALVAVPFYSTDRQRVLIPRGSRFVGTAQPVRGQDQDSLAVGFHRVILPDGRHVPLRFQALNQIGEGALSDRVNRHYLSTFLAAGAVGVMSGLAAVGGSPYAGGFPGFQSSFSQGTAASGQQVMRRFLNRLPEVTVRAGHRLRIWFTSDALFPTT